MNAVLIDRSADTQRLHALERAFAQFNDTALQLQSLLSALPAPTARAGRERDRPHQGHPRTPQPSWNADDAVGAALTQRKVADALARLTAMQGMIDQSVARSCAGAMTNTPLPWGDVVSEALACVEAAPEQRLEVDDAASRICVRGHRRLLASALVNLLDNALRVCGRVRIKAACYRDWIAVLVHDDGPGIKAADAANIFEPFYTTRADGTGLGLPIARSVLRAHGGELALIAGTDGACFEVRLPIASDTPSLIAALPDPFAALADLGPRQGNP